MRSIITTPTTPEVFWVDLELWWKRIGHILVSSRSFFAKKKDGMQGSRFTSQTQAVIFHAQHGVYAKVHFGMSFTEFLGKPKSCIQKHEI